VVLGWIMELRFLGSIGCPPFNGYLPALLASHPSITTGNPSKRIIFNALVVGQGPGRSL
jgi:hypothetical protein